jgi:tetratricopeptide (TPR) repeat protein
MRIREIRIGMAALLMSALLPLSSAQQGGQGSTGSAGNPRRELPRPSIPQPQPGTQIPSETVAHLVLLSGDVVREDGSPPPLGAIIELNCGGSVSKEATVAPNGHYSFQVGGDTRMGQIFPDASRGFEQPGADSDFAGTPMTTSTLVSRMPARYKRLFGCDLRAQLHGYKSTILSFSEEPLSGLNELSKIVVYPIERVKGSSVSATNLLAPKEAKKFLAEGLNSFRKKKFSEAEALLQSAIEAYPNYAEAWFDLGLLYEKQGRSEDARKAYRESIRADKTYVNPYIRLEQLAAAQQSWREAVDLSEQVLTLDPVGLLDVYYINALGHFKLNEMELAERRARQGQQVDYSNRYPQLYLIIAAVLEQKNDATGSIRELRNYLKVSPNAPNAGVVRSHLQKMEDQVEQANAGRQGQDLR